MLYQTHQIIHSVYNMIKFPVPNVCRVFFNTKKPFQVFTKLSALFSQTTQKNQQSFKNNKKRGSVQYYVPIRPLKNQVTTIFGEKQYLNKDKLPKNLNMIPYFIPTLAIIAHNLLMGWSIIGALGIPISFAIGGYFLIDPIQIQARRVLRLEASKDMSYFFLTVPGSYQTTNLKTFYPQLAKVEYQNFGIISAQQLKQYEPTEEQKAKLTPEQIKKKKQEHVSKNIQKIFKFNLKCQQVARFKIKKEDLQFGLSNHPLGDVDQFQNDTTKQPTTKELLTNICRYLIIKTPFYGTKSKKQLAYFSIDLQANGQMKYQDYLLALGRKYQIKKQ